LKSATQVGTARRAVPFWRPGLARSRSDRSDLRDRHHV